MAQRSNPRHWAGALSSLVEADQTRFSWQWFDWNGGGNLDFCGLFWSVRPSKEGNKGILSRDPCEQVLVETRQTNRKRWWMTHYASISWGLTKSIIQLLGSETITQELQGHSGVSQSGVSFHESEAKQDLFFLKNPQRNQFAAIGSPVSSNHWGAALQLLHVQLQICGSDHYSCFTWSWFVCDPKPGKSIKRHLFGLDLGVNSTKLDVFFCFKWVQRLKVVQNRSSGNSAFNFIRQVSLSSTLKKGHYLLQFSYQWLQPQPAMAGWNLHIGSSAMDSWLTDVSTPHRKLQRCSWPCHWDFWGEGRCLNNVAEISAKLVAFVW